MAETVFTASIDKSPGEVTRWLAAKLVKLLEDKHPDQVVILKSQRRAWRRKYKDNDLVRIVTAHDQDVCKACLDMAAHSPYRYADAKKQIPHHPGCRCQIASLRAHDAGYLQQPTFKKIKKYVRTTIKQSIKNAGKKAPQRGATIKKLRKKGRRFVAPSGYRSVKIYQRKGK